MSRKGHQPQRTCLGCGARENQARLIRVTVMEQGELIVNKGQGRGGYLHKHPECWQMFLGRKGHYRAFHATISREARDRLIDQLKGREWE